MMAVPCSACETPLQRGFPDQYPADGPLRQPTPLLRLTALAQYAGIVVTDIFVGDTAGLAGAVGVGLDDSGQLRALVGLADDLDEGLRVDVLAFVLALFTGDPERLIKAPGGRLGVGRERLTPTPGVGHLAFHLAYGCGRDTPSATFELVSLPSV